MCLVYYIMQIFSHMGLPEKRIPSERWLQIGTLTTNVIVMILESQKCLLSITQYDWT